MILEDLRDILAGCDRSDIHLYFIIRTLKSKIKKAAKALDKYDYQLFQVDVDEEIQHFLHDLTLGEFSRLAEAKTESVPYDVIQDDTDQLFTYCMKDKNLSFADLLDNQLPNKSNIPKIGSFSDMPNSSQLWSYCVGFNYKSHHWMYTFRKLMASRIAVDQTRNPESNVVLKSLKAHFSTKTKKLELLHSDVINLDRQVDCIYLDDTFFIAHKRQFEQIVGLEEEFKTKAFDTLAKLRKLDLLEGIELIEQEVERNPSIHRKLVRLSRSGVLHSLDSNAIQNLKKVAELFGEKITIRKGRIVVGDRREIDGTLRLLCDYYKEGKVTGQNYGTFSGRVLRR